MLLVTISSEGPSWEGRHSTLHSLSRPRFEDELRRRGGTKELLDNPDLAELFLPVVQADCQLEETYRSDPTRCTVPFPIIAVHGVQLGRDAEQTTVQAEHAQLWSACSTVLSSRIVALDAHDWYMLEDDDGVKAVLREVTAHFGRFVAPLMPGAKRVD